MVWPLPSGPRWNTCLPIASSSGRARAHVRVAPPTMNTRSPASAPHCAPDTGASIIDAPRAATTCRGLAGQPRLGRRGVDEQRTGFEPGRDAGLAGHRVAHHEAVGQHREHHVGASRGLVRTAASARRGVRVAQTLQRLRRDIEALHPVARFAEVARHRHAHHAEADEADGQQAHASARPIRIFCTSLVPS